MTDFKFEVWPTEFRTINQYFGANPQNYAQFGLPGHEGIDFMALDGTKVFCVAPGTVFAIHPQPTGHNYGTHVRVNHADNYQTTYAHLRQLLVAVGQTVQAGDLLGLADSTGNSTGSHLHLSLKKLDASYLNWPFNITDPTPFVLPLLGFQTPAGPYVDGWASTTGVTLGLGLAQVNSGGIKLRTDASMTAEVIAVVPAGTIMIVTGDARNDYLPVKVARAAVGLPDTGPAPDQPPAAATVDGFAFAAALTLSGSQGVVATGGINLRAQPSRTAALIGLVAAGSTVTLLGVQQGEYYPVRARQPDFVGATVLPLPPPVPPPAPGPGLQPAGTLLGWAWAQNVTVNGNQAVIGTAGINLRAAADQNSAKLGVVNEGSVTTIVGPARGAYIPVWARLDDITGLVSPLPPVAQPDAFPAVPPPPPPAPPPPAPPNTTAGWVFTTQMTVTGQTAAAGQYGLRLRSAPRRDATEVGFIPAGIGMDVTGSAEGEYTPVQVANDKLQPPFGTMPPTSAAGTTGTAATAASALSANPDPPPLGNCRIGLHASADPTITDAEFEEFLNLRPGIVKVLSFHGEADIRRLATSFPSATWIVRAFLDFGGRVIAPEQFVNDTLSDVQRALGVLAGRDVVVELHNEPNVVAEGLSTNWTDGASFATWWLDALGRYRSALPGVRFIYPGLSPGSTVLGVKLDHIQFAEASRPAIEAADGLGIHIYWSSVYPLAAALGVLDDMISRFRATPIDKPIWVTEASNNTAGTSVPDKAQQYLQCWRALQTRPAVQGITYFVASASNPAFAQEVWVGRGIGALVGAR